MVVSEVHLHGAADRGMHGDLLAVSVNEYVPDKLDLDQLPPDYMSLLALMFGLLAYLLVVSSLCVFAVWGVGLSCFDDL